MYLLTLHNIITQNHHRMDTLLGKLGLMVLNGGNFDDKFLFGKDEVEMYLKKMTLENFTLKNFR
jgi:hypothetical protein